MVQIVKRLKPIALQYLDHGRQQLVHIRHARLDPRAGVNPFPIHLLIVADVEGLGIGVGEARVHLEDEQVTRGSGLRAMHRVE